MPSGSSTAGPSSRCRTPAKNRAQLAAAARVEQLRERLSSRSGFLPGEGNEPGDDDSKLIEADSRLLFQAEASEPADGVAGIAMALAVADQQTERERVREGRRGKVYRRGDCSTT